MSFPVLPHGFLGAQGDSDTYRIERSLRFNSADNAHLSRTMGTPTSQTTATLSLWVKRSGISKSNYGDSFWTPEGSNYNIFSFSGSGTGSTDSLRFTFRFAGDFVSKAIYRDPSSWYHIVCVYDSTNATQADRFRFFVNGVRGEFVSPPAFTQNFTFDGALAAGTFRIGDFSLNSNWRPDIYLAEYYFIDGQALTPSSFGETDAITGRWKAKAYSGTYGTNGFYLKFADNSGATATTLGKDSSGNGNNWTPNNFSVTSGAGNDSLVDSPTNYGSDTGLGGEVRGNYCTLSPIDKSSNITLSNGNLDHSQGAATGICKSTIGISSGKWYWEVLVTATSPMVGIANASALPTINYLGADANSWSYDSVGGLKYTNNSSASYGSSYTTNDVIGIAFNADNGTLVFYKNNTSQGTAFSGLTSGPYFPAVSRNIGSPSTSFNFGQRPFAYAAPSGFKALCTQNLPQPTIQKPSSAMDVVTYTGTGASQSISSLGFSPDLVWIKGRSGATDHAIYDTTRGVQQDLGSNLTTDETTQAQGLTAFGTNGFTIGTLAKLNTNTSTYVAWAWDESALDGLDIVSYTGNGTARTISHNLGVAPKMIIVKARTTAGTDQGWPVYHASNTAAPETDYLLLNSTAATADLDTVWNDTAPTASVFSVGTNALVNTNNDTYIAYLFSEVEGFSKFGSYTGNGSSDGPFVWCGFRPRWVMIKNSSSAYSWIIYDTARSTENLVTLKLAPNNSQEENGSSIGGVTFNTMDILSNGFKLRSTNVDSNASGNTIIFAAFAESTFKYARAR